MTSKLKENIINPTKNIKLQKAEEITGHSDSRKENISKISASLKKYIYLQYKKKQCQQFKIHQLLEE